MQCCVFHRDMAANTLQAYDIISSATADLLNRSPSMFVAVMGNFNHTNLSTFFTYIQVLCGLQNQTLDLFYTNATEAFTSIPLPPLGRPYHNLVYLQPLYKPAI